MAKLGEQVGVKRATELRAGKLEQQKGIKPSVAYTIKKREYTQSVSKQQRIEKEIQSFQAKNLTYSNYETEYNKLSSEAKKYITSPTAVKATPEYKSYEQKVTAYSSYKTDYEIARKFALTGKSSIGLANKRQREMYVAFKENLETINEYKNQLNVYVDELEQPMSVDPSQLNSTPIIRDVPFSFGSTDFFTPTEQYQKGQDFFKQVILEQPTQPSLKQIEEIKVPTNFTYTEKREFAEARTERLRSFDFSKGDFVARTKEGGISIPGTFATTFLTTGETTAALLRVDKVWGKISKKPIIVQKGQAVRFVSDLFTFAMFSPAMQTTAQLTKSLQPKDVIFKGVEQKTDKGFIKTDIKFYTSDKKVGIARGISKIGQEGETTFSKTIAGGGTFQKGVKFPSGKLIIKPTSSFGGKQWSILKEGDEIMKLGKVSGVSVGKKMRVSTEAFVGKVVSRKGSGKLIDTYFGLGKGVASKGKSYLISKSLGQKTGLARSLGVIAKTSTKKSFGGYVRGGLGSSLITKPTLKLAEQSTKEIIQRGVQSAPKIASFSSVIAGSVSSSIPQSAYYGKGLYERTPASVSYNPSQKTISDTKIRIIQDQTPQIKTIPSTAFNTKSLEITKEITKQKIAQEQIPKEKIVPLIKERYIQFQKQKERTISSPRYKSPIKFIPSIPKRTITPKRTPIAIVTPKRKKPPIKRRNVRFLKRKPTKVKRRPSLVAFGLNIKSPKIKGRETAFSIRPIITKKKRKKRKRKKK